MKQTNMVYRINSFCGRFAVVLIRFAVVFNLPTTCHI